MRRHLLLRHLCAVMVLWAAVAPAMPAGAATYYVAATGADGADGLSPQRPWGTLGRVNHASLKPGDRVLFRRGDQWRGSLAPRSGAAGAPVTYGAYGAGPKPLLLGSVSRSSPRDWTDRGGNLWTTGEPAAVLRPPFPPADASERAIRWAAYCEGGAAASGTPQPTEPAPAAYRLDCASSGTELQHVQLSVPGLRVRTGCTYVLLARVRATQPFRLGMPVLMRAAPPWTDFSPDMPRAKCAVGHEPTDLVQYYRATDTDNSARLTFYLGGALPAGSSLTIERLALRECAAADAPPPAVLPVDVGNLIFGREAGCGVKQWTRADLKAPGDFWYDPEAQVLWLRSDRNPAERHGRVECAMNRHIISQSNCSYVVYEDLSLKYGGAHGLGGANTHHITTRRCDLAYLGGADQYGGDQHVRFGNGIEFWADASDNLVEDCRLWEIYDAALTNQNLGRPAVQANITYRRNIIWNSEYSLEYWNRPATSQTRNVRFVNNTCVNAGHGWGHAQRPDPSGRHLCFYASDAPAEGLEIRNNIFCGATGNAFYAPGWPVAAVRALAMDHNLWYQPQGTMLAVTGRNFAMAAFALYQQEFGVDRDSVAADPLFVAPAAGDFHLRPDSPCRDAGVTLRDDPSGEGRPRSPRVPNNIGAY